MNKIFQSIPGRYLFRVTIPSIFCIAILPLVIIKLINSPSALFYALVALLCFLFAYDNFVSLSHPKRISFIENKIELYAFGRKHTFSMDTLERLSIREGSFNRNLYVRIGKPSFSKGKYWISKDMYENGEELISILKEKEGELHPMLDKFKRRSSKRIRN